jgi:trehalose 6-phosphate phosphatase
VRHVLSKKGEAALGAVMRRRPLLAFDFDGTLAPIAPRPHQVQVPPGVAQRLATLGQSLPVAIVTGRAVADVRPRLGFVPRYVVGSHGAEDELDPDGSAARARALDPLRSLLRDSARLLDEAGVQFEDKAQSIALHYRMAPQPQAAAALVRQLLALVPPTTMHVFEGKAVINAVAAGAPDKAHAVTTLVARSGAACAVYIGDDVNDDPVFAAAPPRWLTVRVGRDDPSSRARFFLDSSSEVTPFLDRLLAHRPRPAAD